MLDRKSPALGRFIIEETEAERTGQGDVLRLADVETFRLQRVDRLTPRRGHRREVLRDPFRIDDIPLDTIKRGESPGQRAWLSSDAESAAKFSAVGYFFGRDLRKALGVPVGLIHTSWGGTPSEAWTSKRTLEANPAYKGILDDYERVRTRYPEAMEKFEQAKAEHRKKVEQAKADGKPIPKAPTGPPGPNSPQPTRLYNAMIAPLVPYAIRGAIWYQGEANAGR